MLEKILPHLPFKKTILAASLFLGLAGCGAAIENNYRCQENEIRQTYSEDLSTLNKGNCRPQLERCENGEYIPVQDEVTPTTEKCDYQDNDCDGRTDEDFELDEPCYVGQGLCRVEGTRQCSSTNPSETYCFVYESDIPEPGEEICNDHLDNNCDGQTDETDCLSRSSTYECGNLSWYPGTFHTDGVFNGYFVVGEAAQPIDNLSMTNIATSMWYEKPVNCVSVEEGVEECEGELSLIQVSSDATKLDTEIVDVSAQNLIVIGSPCVNAITAELLGNPDDCTEGFSPGKARIIMLKNTETNNLAMIVAGYTGEDTRLAAKVIAHRYHELQEIGGCEVEISGTTYSDATIGTPTIVERVIDDPFLGNPDAQVTITEFGGYQCRYSKRFHDHTLPLIISNYIESDLVKFIFKDLPLSFHSYSQKAAEAAECAREQGEFWPYHHILFDNQSSINEENMKSWAETLGLDTVSFNQCYDSGKYESLVLEDVTEAGELDVIGTPTFLINGRMLTGSQPYSVFEEKIEEELRR